MTLADTDPTGPQGACAPPPVTGVRAAATPAELAARRERAVAAFERTRLLAEEAASSAARSREMRMDATRRLEVLTRSYSALQARNAELLEQGGALLHGARRVVLVHRSEWFLDRLTAALSDSGLHVVARLDNGADAVGVAVAEQPDLLLVEETLAMLPGEQVVREVRELCPDTLVAAQVASGARAPVLLEAGAARVFARSLSPLEVAHGVAELLAG